MIPLRATWLVLPLLAAACAPAIEIETLRQATGVEVTSARPPDAAEGTCWAVWVKPAVIETVTEQEELRAATFDAAGKMIAGAEFRTVTSARIVEDRQDMWFETPCPDVLTSEFAASVQRALRARGLYAGPISASFDQRTEKAIWRYQEGLGISSGRLSLAAARALGLIAVPRQ